MSRKRRIFIRFFAMFIIFLMGTAFLPISTFATEFPTITATITVDKKLAGDVPSNDETFFFTLTPDDTDYPMPDGITGNTIAIRGEGTASFGAITYSEPNAYGYTVTEIPGTSSNCIYDETVYHVTVYVTTDDDKNLTSVLWVTKNGAEEKSANAVFTNSYIRPVEPDQPYTGGSSKISWWSTLAGVSAAALLILLAIKAHDRKELDGAQSET